MLPRHPTSAQMRWVLSPRCIEVASFVIPGVADLCAPADSAPCQSPRLDAASLNMLASLGLELARPLVPGLRRSHNNGGPP
jgi:hypothetical protein